MLSTCSCPGGRSPAGQLTRGTVHETKKHQGRLQPLRDTRARTQCQPVRHGFSHGDGKMGSSTVTPMEQEVSLHPTFSNTRMLFQGTRAPWVHGRDERLAELGAG